MRLDEDALITAEQNRALQKRNAQLEEENFILKKIHCDIHATLRQRWIAVHSLRHEHAVTTLCRVLGVNRSTYYKFHNRKDSHKTVESRALRAKILALYTKSDKRLGTQKMTECLAQEYRIHISCGRVYRLMKTMDLPRMSSVKPPKRKSKSNAEDGVCHNRLQQQFRPEKPKYGSLSRNLCKPLK